MKSTEELVELNYHTITLSIIYQNPRRIREIEQYKVQTKFQDQGAYTVSEIQQAGKLLDSSSSLLLLSLLFLDNHIFRTTQVTAMISG